MFAERMSKRRRSLRGSGQAGMTLTEIMIVLAIISMIMGFAGFVGFGQLEKAKVKDTRIVMHQVKNALVRWQADTNESCPATLSELMENKKKEPKDGWGETFIFKCPGDHDPDIDLISKGKDKKEGTEDDIKSWEDEDSGAKKKP